MTDDVKSSRRREVGATDAATILSEAPLTVADGGVELAQPGGFDSGEPLDATGAGETVARGGAEIDAGESPAPSGGVVTGPERVEGAGADAGPREPVAGRPGAAPSGEASALAVASGASFGDQPAAPAPSNAVGGRGVAGAEGVDSPGPSVAHGGVLSGAETVNPAVYDLEGAAGEEAPVAGMSVVFGASALSDGVGSGGFTGSVAAGAASLEAETPEEAGKIGAGGEIVATGAGRGP